MSGVECNTITGKSCMLLPMKMKQESKWFVLGDIDGFFGLAIDNLVQLLVIVTLCKTILGFGDALLYGQVLPGVAVSLVIGNLFYAWQGRRLGLREGRGDVCALPYGINTPSVFAYIFLVMLPVNIAARSGGMSDHQAAELAWQAGLVACFGSGLIELGGSLVAEHIRKFTPRAALLSTLAGIAITFIAMPFIFETFGHPVVGFATLAVIAVSYWGGMRFKGRIPAGLVAVILGTLLAWLTEVGGGSPMSVPREASFYLPVPVIGDLIAGLQNDVLLGYVGIILPMGIFNVIGSMQNIESAEAEGDSYDTRSSLAANGIGTLAAACFGSCFPTTIYIGHPGWKRLGARVGYSVMNAGLMTMLCLFGLIGTISNIIPIEAGMAIVIWIGIVITAQAFTATPRKHAPAVVIGLLPGIAAWGIISIKTALQVSGQPMFLGAEATTLEFFDQRYVNLHGAFAIEQGFIITAMLFSAITVFVIERRFYTAGIWSLIGALLSSVGLLHSYRWTLTDTVVDIGFVDSRQGLDYVIGYGVMALIFFVIPWITTPQDENDCVPPQQE